LESDEQLPPFFVTARDIPYPKRLGMQSVWQQYVDASISSTINLPEDATVEDVEELYMLAYHYGLKGVTVFRENCRRAGILTTEKKEEPKKMKLPGLRGKTSAIDEALFEAYIPRGYIIPAGDNLIGKKRKLTTGCGSLHCTAFFDPETGNLMETYLSRGSTGGCANSYTGLSRMISLAARGGVPLDAIVDQLNSCGICPSYAVRRTTRKDTSPGACCPIAVGKALVEMHDEMMNELWGKAISEVKKEMKKADPAIAMAMKPLPDNYFSTAEAESLAKSMQAGYTVKNYQIHNTCPECGEPLTHEGGCDICKNCGWSHCN
jgi:ribonucleoside-diphosphate reductase alpha chain